MGINNKVKQKLLDRGFDSDHQLNNRGLIGATVDETAKIMVEAFLGWMQSEDCWVTDLSGKKIQNAQIDGKDFKEYVESVNPVTIEQHEETSVRGSEAYEEQGFNHSVYSNDLCFECKKTLTLSEAKGGNCCDECWVRDQIN